MDPVLAYRYFFSMAARGAAIQAAMKEEREDRVDIVLVVQNAVDRNPKDSTPISTSGVAPTTMASGAAVPAEDEVDYGEDGLFECLVGQPQASDGEAAGGGSTDQGEAALTEPTLEHTTRPLLQRYTYTRPLGPWGRVYPLVYPLAKAADFAAFASPHPHPNPGPRPYPHSHPYPHPPPNPGPDPDPDPDPNPN